MIGGRNTLALDDENLNKFMVRSVAPRFCLIIFAYLAFVEVFLNRSNKKQSKKEKKIIGSDNDENIDQPVEKVSHHPESVPSLATSSPPLKVKHKANDKGDDDDDGVEWDLHTLAISGVPVSEVPGVLELAQAIGATKVKLEPLCDPLTLLRFLRARDGVFKDALSMYNETILWRRDFEVDKTMNDFGESPSYIDGASRAFDQHNQINDWKFKLKPKTQEAILATKHSFFGVLEKPDNEEDGAPVGIWRLGSMDFAGVKRENMEYVMIQAFVAHLEDMFQGGRAASFKRKRLIRGRLIIDASNLGGGIFKHLPTLKTITSMGKAYFPEINSTVTIVNAPWIFAKVFSVISTFLTEAMRKKIIILDSNFEAALQNHSGLHISALPQFLGGQTSDEQCPPPEPIPKGAGRVD